MVYYLGFTKQVKQLTRLLRWGAPSESKSTAWTLFVCPLSLDRGYRTERTTSVPLRDKKYVDRLILEVKAGNGGNGCASFWKSIAKGKNKPADGGDGGRGGDVYIQASKRTKSLGGLRQLIQAKSGGHGGKQKKTGTRGNDAVISVPLGTVVHLLEDLQAKQDQDAEVNVDEASNEVTEEEQEVKVPDWIARWKEPWVGELHYNSDEEEDLDGWQGSTSQAQSGNTLADLVEDESRVLVAKGGSGGKGNASVRSRHTRLAPTESESGHKGQHLKLLLEVKLMADVGLVGFPNAGKSTLLRALSAAQPQVGDYAFTTLRPNLGTITYEDGSQLVVADVPGLIEGAHMNRGLGHAFLRHIERTRCVAYVVDITAGQGSDDRPPPWEQLEMLQHELAIYNTQLLDRPALVVANKIDDIECPTNALQRLRRRSVDMEVVPVSALKQQGTQQLKMALRKLSPTDIPFGW